MRLSRRTGRSDPKKIPPATVSTLSLNASVDTTEDVSTDDESSSRTSEPPKKKKKRRCSKSSASEMIEFLKEFKEEKRKEEQEKIALVQHMHGEKMGIMARFLDILAKK